MLKKLRTKHWILNTSAENLVHKIMLHKIALKADPKNHNPRIKPYLRTNDVEIRISLTKPSYMTVN